MSNYTLYIMLIIGITGTIGAGKGTIVNFLVEKYNFKHLSVRDFLRKKIEEKGYTSFDRDILTKVANELRNEHSPSYIIDKLYFQAKQLQQNTVIESIRTLGEITSLRQKGNFILLGIDALPEVRYERVLQRKSETDQISFETFLANEKREMYSTDPTKQNLAACIAEAEYRLCNDGNIEQLENQIIQIMQEITHLL